MSPAPLIQVKHLVKHFPVRQSLLARGPAGAVPMRTETCDVIISEDISGPS